jgi:hypothetical protein
MPDPGQRLRAQIRTLQQQRRSVESKLLQPQSMLAASLVERFLKDGGGTRRSPAYYLSRSQQGRSRLTYVKKKDLPRVRQQCAAYRAFQQNRKHWRQLTVLLEGLWQQLQRAQSQ